jgi:hypothetical protein
MHVPLDACWVIGVFDLLPHVLVQVGYVSHVAYGLSRIAEEAILCKHSRKALVENLFQGKGQTDTR